MGYHLEIVVVHEEAIYGKMRKENIFFKAKIIVIFLWQLIILFLFMLSTLFLIIPSRVC